MVVESRWTRETLLELSRSFMLSRIFLSAAELRLFDILAKCPLSLEDICDKTHLKPRGMRILLDALAASGLVSKGCEGRYAVSRDLAKLLTTSSEDSILPAVLHGDALWKSWSNLTQIVRQGENDFRMPISERSDEEIESFIGAMHVIGEKMAQRVAEAIDLGRFSRLLDVGGASGTYVMAFLKREPNLTATVFDLPRVTNIARRRIEKEGFSDRVNVAPGDYMVNELPRGHDLVLLSAVIHSNSREENITLYKKVFQALEPGGAILIRDYLMDSTRTRPTKGAVFAVNMLAATRDGDAYTLDEVTDDLKSAGFVNIHLVLDGKNMDQIIEGEKPL